VLVIDMNGTIVKRWEGYNNSAGGPARVLPGGVVIAAAGARPPHRSRWSTSSATSTETSGGDFQGTVHHDP
jgi:hypothetical protein